jgi:hypothetical protein
MASVKGLRQALATNIGSITGLRTASSIPEVINPPIAVVYPAGAPVEFHLASQNATSQFNFEIMIIVGRADARNAQDELDAYISTTGTKSALLAIELDRTLSGLAFDCIARRVSSYGSTEINNIEYLAATIQVDVIAN